MLWKKSAARALGGLSLIWHLLDAVVADPRVMNSSPRRAFRVNASKRALRSTHSSISLMVPFIPGGRLRSESPADFVGMRTAIRH